MWVGLNIIKEEEEEEEEEENTDFDTVYIRRIYSYTDGGQQGVLILTSPQDDSQVLDSYFFFSSFV